MHLVPLGASYRGTAEIFLEGRPLNVTGATFGPDGDLYFLTGGRRTQSGLYRVKWTGNAGDAAPARNDAAAEKARALRRTLESFHGHVDKAALAVAWPVLDSTDAWLRHAARIAVEEQPVGTWLELALSEPRTTAALEACLALARVGGNKHQPRLLGRLRALDAPALTAEQRLTWLRALEISFLRDDAQPAADFLPVLEPLFPSASPEVNQLLCELLVFVRSSAVVGRALPLLAEKRPQEERLFYLFTLAKSTAGWSLETRRAWLAALGEAKRHSVGGHTLGSSLDYARNDFAAGLTAEEKTALTTDFANLDESVPFPALLAPRPFVNAWTLDSLARALATLSSPPDPARGKKLFTAASCAQCHRISGEGGLTGPDLSAIGQRFDRRAMAESMIDPWKVIAEQYRYVSVTLKSGAVVSGRVVSENADQIVLAINPVDPDSKTTVPRADIANTLQFSPMPPGLLNTLTAEEARDLLAFLEAAR